MMISDSALLFWATLYITTHLSIPKGRQVELAWLVDPQRTLFPLSGQMPTVDREKISETPPAKDRHLDH